MFAGARAAHGLGRFRNQRNVTFTKYECMAGVDGGLEEEKM